MSPHSTSPDEPIEHGADGHSVSPFPLHSSAGEIRIGYFTFREKLGRLLWQVVQSTIFRISPRRADEWRAFLLRCFGAKIGRKTLIRSNVQIEIPWNLTLGDEAKLGEKVIIYNLSHITIGDRAMVSQYAHLCGGTHDHTRSDLPLYRVPIRIESDAWVCTDVYVGPGVVIGEGALVGARSTVVTDLPPWKICVGNPARPVKDRPFRRIEKGHGIIARHEA